MPKHVKTIHVYPKDVRVLNPSTVCGFFFFLLKQLSSFFLSSGVELSFADSKKNPRIYALSANSEKLVYPMTVWSIKIEYKIVISIECPAL